MSSGSYYDEPDYLDHDDNYQYSDNEETPSTDDELNLYRMFFYNTNNENTDATFSADNIIDETRTSQYQPLEYENTDNSNHLLHRTFVPVAMEVIQQERNKYISDQLNRADLLKIYDVMLYPGQQIIINLSRNDLENWMKQLIKLKTFFVLVSHPFFYDHFDLKNIGYHLYLNKNSCKPFYGTLAQVEAFSFADQSSYVYTSSNKLLLKGVCRALIVDYNPNIVESIMKTGGELVPSFKYTSDVGFYTVPFNYNDAPFLNANSCIKSPINPDFPILRESLFKDVLLRSLAVKQSNYLSNLTHQNRTFTLEEYLDYAWSYLPVDNETRLEAYTCQYLWQTVKHLAEKNNTNVYCSNCRNVLGTVDTATFFNGNLKCDLSTCTSSFLTNPTGIPFEVFLLNITKPYNCISSRTVNNDTSFIINHGWSYLSCGNCSDFIGWAFSKRHIPRNQTSDNSESSDNNESSINNESRDKVIMVIKKYCQFHP